MDYASGSGNGLAKLVWQAPVDGIHSVTGAIWLGRDIGRGNAWRINLNDVTLTSGNVYSGDPYDRTNPYYFKDGSGGPDALVGLIVQSGDRIELIIEKTGVFGEFAGLEMRITDDGVSAVEAPGPVPVQVKVIPNPFNPRTALRYSLPEPSWVRLAVYDGRGRLVATLVDEQRPAGSGSAVWNGMDARGAAAASGVYFARLETAGGVTTQKLVLAR
jgi:hypothetical protein